MKCSVKNLSFKLTKKLVNLKERFNSKLTIRGKNFMFPKIFWKIFKGFLIILNSLPLLASDSPPEEVILSKADFSQLKFPEVIFMDWDNTIINSWPLLISVFNKTLVEYDKPPLAETEFYNLPNVNMPITDIISGLFKENRPDVVQAYWKNYHEQNSAKPLNIDNDAKGLLTFFKNRNLFLAIVSNQEQAVLEGNVKRSGLEKYFNTIVGAIRDQPCQNKPMVGAIIRALENNYYLREKIGQSNKNWWFVGDGDSDIKTAINANCFPVWVAQYAIKPINFSDFQAYPQGLKVNSLKQLMEILNEILIKTSP